MICHCGYITKLKTKKKKKKDKKKTKTKLWSIIHELPIFIIVDNGQLLFSAYIDFGGLFI
jgi:hypothetical protein